MNKRDQWKGLKSLVHDAVDTTVDLVREGHGSASRSVCMAGDATSLGPAVRTVESVRMTATEGVLSIISAVNRTIEVVSDAALDRVWPSTPEQPGKALPLRDDVAGEKQWWGDALVGAVNGALGDHLDRRRNPLGAAMVFRLGDHYFPMTSRKTPEFEELEHVAVFVHGLAATEWSWVLGAEQSWGDPAECFGTNLSRHFGMTPVYVRYNTGRPLGENGRELAAKLAEFARRSPNLQSMTLFGHSMGGLVIREALSHAERRGASWTPTVRDVFYLGSPHRGAPLARFAQGAAGVLDSVDLPATRIIASVINGRSEGIKDLAAGLELALPLPDAQHTFISGTVTRDPDHPVGSVLGDLLVRRSSAEGEGVVSRSVPISRAHRGRVLHHEIQNHPAVYEIIEATLKR